MIHWALVAVGYCCGMFPTGILLARAAGVDPRRQGSGNVGATNVLRTAGVRLGVLTLLGDALKGALPVIAARIVAPGVEAQTAVAAVLGHVLPVAPGLKGGKGVATGLGVLVVLSPMVAVLAIVVFAGVVGRWRYVSAGSMAAALSTCPAAWALSAPWSTVVATGAIGALILLRHRENLGRLIEGSEPRLQLPKRQASHGK